MFSFVRKLRYRGKNGCLRLRMTCPVGGRYARNRPDSYATVTLHTLCSLYRL